MSIHWNASFHEYRSAQPTEIPVREVVAVLVPHHDSR
jgi:hypothetical protein